MLESVQSLSDTHTHTLEKDYCLRSMFLDCGIKLEITGEEHGEMALSHQNQNSTWGVSQDQC